MLTILLFLLFHQPTPQHQLLYEMSRLSYTLLQFDGSCCFIILYEKEIQESVTNIIIYGYHSQEDAASI